MLSQLFSFSLSSCYLALVMYLINKENLKKRKEKEKNV